MISIDKMSEYQSLELLYLKHFISKGDKDGLSNVEKSLVKYSLEE
jgi:hypothetical protein